MEERPRKIQFKAPCQALSTSLNVLQPILSSILNAFEHDYKGETFYNIFESTRNTAQHFAKRMKNSETRCKSHFFIL